MTYNILKFEHLYGKMMEHEMKQQDSGLTFKLLHGACISDDDRKLEKMKQALKRLLLSSQNTQINQQNIKQAYYSKKQKDIKYEKPSDNYKQVSKSLKPLDKNCIVLRYIRGSKLHWANNCPYKGLEDFWKTEKLNQQKKEFKEPSIVVMSE